MISVSLRYLTDPEPITRILVHIGEPPSLHPPRKPPQTEFDIKRAGGEADHAAQGYFPDDLDQTPQFDPAEREPVIEDDFDQTRGA